MEMNPPITLQPLMDLPAHCLKTYSYRRVDVATNIRVRVPNHGEYVGEYLAHGQSKTTFALSCADQRFDGKVFKITKKLNRESRYTPLVNALLANTEFNGLNARSSNAKA